MITEKKLKEILKTFPTWIEHDGSCLWKEGFYNHIEDPARSKLTILRRDGKIESGSLYEFQWQHATQSSPDDILAYELSVYITPGEIRTHMQGCHLTPIPQQ